MKQILFVISMCWAAWCATPGSTSDVLRRTGRSVEDFWNQLSAVNCVETVAQQKVGVNGKIIYSRESVFDYLAVLQMAGDDLIVDESRSPIRESAPTKSVPLLMTSGFSAFEFIFHPFYQAGFEYSTPEAVRVDGQDLLAVRFRHVHGTRSPSVLKLRRREYPVEWQGTAWIEPESGAIVHISAGLMAGMEDLGLKALNADVRYGRVEFQDDPGVHWLPSVATVEIETVRQRWRNVHTFTKYRHFSVDVKTEMETPK